MDSFRSVCQTSLGKIPNVYRTITFWPPHCNSPMDELGDVFLHLISGTTELPSITYALCYLRKYSENFNPCYTTYWYITNSVFGEIESYSSSNRISHCSCAFSCWESPIVQYSPCAHAKNALEKLWFQLSCGQCIHLVANNLMTGPLHLQYKILLRMTLNPRIFNLTKDSGRMNHAGRTQPYHQPRIIRF